MSDCMVEEVLSLYLNEPYRRAGDCRNVYAPLGPAPDLRDHQERVVFKDVNTGQLYTCSLHTWREQFTLDRRLATPAPSPAPVVRAEKSGRVLDLRQQDSGH